MIITAYKPRPDISENTEERIDIELPDEEIVKIGKRYFELMNVNATTGLCIEVEINEQTVTQTN